ncbi:ribulose-phosphate 3-epimerase [Pedobacter deserti]|uniref:ribulose-phosphate 3-epimerase n=1 Tax=Pedobacter deserti TaxID=2817382 RepID=UPI0021086ED4|nr:ribulose-phosphate 3-epimerase [Pedobacter sp. SYSU D00382]
MNINPNHLIAPSVLSADFGNLLKDIQMINSSEADWFHVDIMDGVFVPNISFGFPVLEVLKAYAQKPLDVHLMIESPERYIERFAEGGAAVITVHYEACVHLHRVVELIRSTGCKAGVAINPHTPTALLKDILPDLDLALVMSVNPGFGGQKFIPNALNKVRELRAMAERLNPELVIEVDGGIGMANLPDLVMAGADVLVAGNSIFGADSPEQMIADLKFYNHRKA